MRGERLEQARLYFVTDLRPETEEVVRSVLDSGVDLVQLRDRRLSDRELVAAGRRLVALCRARGALFLVNDRPDLAVECGADGVHVGQDDVAVAEARASVGAERLVGLSTHSPGQIGASAGADYISVGPVWETPTKEGRPAVGLDLVGYAAAHAVLPFFAIGGIDESNVVDVVAAGARRIAVVRAIRDALDPAAAARGLLTPLNRP